MLACSAHELEVDEFAARPEEDRLTAAEKNERINKQLQVCHHWFTDAGSQALVHRTGCPAHVVQWSNH